VLADHGATDNGGHAGPELIVRHTPLVTWGPGMPHGALGAIRQRDVPNRVLQALGLPPLSSAGLTEVPPSWWSVGMFVCVAIVTLACSIHLWAALMHGIVIRHAATVLNGALWIGLLLLLRGWYSVAACLTILTLLMAAMRLSPGGLPGMWNVLGYSVLFGVLRLGDGLLVSQSSPGSGIAWLSWVSGSVMLLSGGAIVLASFLPAWRQLRTGHATCQRMVVWLASHITVCWLLVSGLGAVVWVVPFSRWCSPVSWARR
jgi:hypothetical protein